MLFVALMKVKAGTEEERIGRRLEWEAPEGMEIVGEYWLHTTDPEIVVVIEADGFASLLGFTGAWNDVYDIKIYPAIGADEGLELVKQMMG